MNDGLRAAVMAMQRKKIAVVGDMVADVYLYGKISRISREAPVLVLEEENETVIAGGAANVVHNVATLGGEVYAIGVLGDDRAGRGLTEILASKGVLTDGVVTDLERATVTKTRIVAGGAATVSQQIVRLDRETKDPLSAATARQLMGKLEELLPKVDGVVLSDYGSGTLTDEMIFFAIEYCRMNEVPCIVDSRYRIMDFAGVGYVKQNDAELAEAMKTVVRSADDLVAAGREMLLKMQAKGVLITRGDEGMTLLEADGSVHHIPVSDVSEVYDVSGAGDTCVAAMILGLVAGVEPLQAARLSNFAAGIAVRKFGTTAVSAEQLLKVIGEQ